MISSVRVTDGTRGVIPGTDADAEGAGTRGVAAALRASGCGSWCARALARVRRGAGQPGPARAGNGPVGAARVIWWAARRELTGPREHVGWRADGGEERKRALAC